MDQERNLGVTEARFALTLLTCVLVAIGYVVLLRLGGTKQSTPDPDDVSPPIVASPHDPNETEQQPHVLTVEKPEVGPGRR